MLTTLPETILWRRLDRPGHESCQLSRTTLGWLLEGLAVFGHEQQPCALSYSIRCTASWETKSAVVRGWVGNNVIDVDVNVVDQGSWLLNGKGQPDLTGCLDIDLNFSPSTNTLPIRRLNLEIGEERDVQAAWLRFPGFTLELLKQRYRRLDRNTYHYESADGTFVRVLPVSEAGLVTHYPGFWLAENAHHGGNDAMPQSSGAS